MEEVTDPAEWKKARAQDERFERNWAWFEAHTADILTPRTVASAFALLAQNCLSLTPPKKRLLWPSLPILTIMAASRALSRTKGYLGSMLISGTWHVCV